MPPVADAPTTRSGMAKVEEQFSLLMRRARSVSLSIARSLHPSLQPGAYAVLLLIMDGGEAVRAVDIAARTGLDKSTMSRELSHLAALGLIERVPDPDDGRARLVRLTDDGRSRFQRAREERRAHLRERLATWEPTEIEDLARLLSKLNGTLEA